MRMPLSAAATSSRVRPPQRVVARGEVVYAAGQDGISVIDLDSGAVAEHGQVSSHQYGRPAGRPPTRGSAGATRSGRRPDRKSTRLNSSHVKISYAVFC